MCDSSLLESLGAGTSQLDFWFLKCSSGCFVEDETGWEDKQGNWFRDCCCYIGKRVWHWVWDEAMEIVCLQWVTCGICASRILKLTFWKGTVILLISQVIKLELREVKKGTHSHIVGKWQTLHWVGQISKTMLLSAVIAWLQGRSCFSCSGEEMMGVKAIVWGCRIHQGDRFDPSGCWQLWRVPCKCSLLHAGRRHKVLGSETKDLSFMRGLAPMALYVPWEVGGERGRRGFALQPRNLLFVWERCYLSLKVACCQ